MSNERGCDSWKAKIDLHLLMKRRHIIWVVLTTKTLLRWTRRPDTTIKYNNLLRSNNETTYIHGLLCLYQRSETLACHGLSTHQFKLRSTVKKQSFYRYQLKRWFTLCWHNFNYKAFDIRATRLKRNCPRPICITSFWPCRAACIAKPEPIIHRCILRA